MLALVITANRGMEYGPVLTKNEIADFTDISVQILLGTR